MYMPMQSANRHLPPPLPPQLNLQKANEKNHMVNEMQDASTKPRSSSCSIQRRHLNPRRRHSRRSACSDYKICSTGQPVIHLPHHYSQLFNEHDSKNYARPTELKYLESGCNKKCILFGNAKLWRGLVLRL